MATENINTKSLVLCACGCGQERERFDSRGRERKFILGHLDLGGKVEYQCQQCGVKFKNFKSDKSKYCTKACKDAGISINHKHSCSWCKKIFYTKKKTSQYCSLSCSGKNAIKYRPSDKGKPKLRQRGDKHWNWKGGYDSRGAYIKRRTRLANAIRVPYIREEIFERDEGLCGICGKFIDRKFKNPHPQAFTIQHLVPISKGGADATWNITSAHRICNIRMGTQVQIGRWLVMDNL